MPSLEAPCVEIENAPRCNIIAASPSSSEISSASSPEPPVIQATPLFRALAMPPPDPEQPPGQDELERRLPGYRRIVIPRELTLIELLKQSSGASTDEEVLRIRDAKLCVVADRVGLRRLHVLAPRLRKLVLDGSAIASLRDLGIGLVHLRILSINKCNLTSFDGVWGLGTLRELYAAGNRFRDLHPLAALQKLQTLDLSDNPIEDSSHIWTLGVCGALRKLVLNGTPASNTMDYRFRVASALPMLIYLDNIPLHLDIEYDSDGVFGAASSSESDVEEELKLSPRDKLEVTYTTPGPSTSQLEDFDDLDLTNLEEPCGSIEPPIRLKRNTLRRRPATTENAGIRPARPDLPARPKTAVDKPVIDEPSRLQILNTLMDDEWVCSGSKLTSINPVCGNLARALRGTSAAYRRHNKEAELSMQVMEDASRSVAAEIPRAPKLEDWIKFKEDTGIDINIDLSDRPTPDPSKILDRLEEIEKTTQQRFKDEQMQGASTFKGSFQHNYNDPFPNGHTSTRSDYELWSHSGSQTRSLSSNSDIDTFFDNVTDMLSIRGGRLRFAGSNSHDEY